MIKPVGVLKHSLLLLMAVFYANLTHAEWSLQNSPSTLSFVSVKNSAVAEVHTFKQLSGKIDDSGKVLLAIDLNSINTNIQIRDQRMRTMLLETHLYPQATLTAVIDTKLIKQLKPGANKTLPVSFTLNLHGQKRDIKAQVLVVALDKQRVLVSTVAPVVLNLAGYNLIKGVNALRDIAKLSSISSSVVVSAQLVFSQKP